MANVLINGGSRGIGRGICEAFIKNGDQVCYTCKDEENLEKSKNILEPFVQDNHLYGLLCNSRNAVKVKETVESAEHLMGGIDILVNNAGVRKYGTIEQVEVEDWIEAVETNINGYFYYAKYALPYLLKSRNAFIFNIGSTAGVTAFSGGISYNATKSAVHGFSASLELDVRRRGVRVCNVVLGNVYNKDLPCKEEDEWMLKPIDVGNCIVNQTKLEKNSMTSYLLLKPTDSPDHPDVGIRALRYV